MKVVLFFWREETRTPESLRHLMFGRYGEGGILFVMDNMMEGFWTSKGTKYKRYYWVSKSERMWGGCEADLLLLSLNDEEQYKLWSTCDACVQAGKPFNLMDILLMHVPFRDVPDRSVIDAPTLNNAQAIILMLRESLRVDNPLRNGIEGLNSRQTFMEDLYERIRPYSLPILWTNLNNLVKWPTDVVSYTPRVEGHEH
jgi:hypothetical protein